jgi:hypothetical protein
MGAMAAAFGLPMRCVCLPGFLMNQLADALGRVLWQLGGALAGAAMILAGAAWLAQIAAGTLALEGGGDLLGLQAALQSGAGAREPLLLPGAGQAAAMGQQA